MLFRSSDSTVKTVVAILARVDATVAAGVHQRRLAHAVRHVPGFPTLHLLRHARNMGVLLLRRHRPRDQRADEVCARRRRERSLLRVRRAPRSLKLIIENFDHLFLVRLDVIIDPE